MGRGWETPRERAWALFLAAVHGSHRVRSLFRPATATPSIDYAISNKGPEPIRVLRPEVSEDLKRIATKVSREGRSRQVRGFGKVMSAVRPRLAVGYHIWANPEFKRVTEQGVRRTYDGEYVQATDLTVINATDERVVVREAVVSEMALPTGTTKEYLTAYRSKVDANTKISKYLADGRWQGFKPRPLPEKRQ